MSLNDFSTITVSASGPALTQVGFGTLLILAYHTNTPERTKVYERDTFQSALVTDGFATNSAAYKAISKAFSQNPSMPSLKLGRADNAATVTYRLTPVTANGLVYSIELELEGEDPVTISFTSSGSATADEICDGLQAAIELVNGTGEPLDGVTVTPSGGTATYIDVIAPEGVALWARDWRHDRIAFKDVTANPGIAADIATIRLADDDWYGFGLADTNSVAAALVAAGEIEATRKLFFTNTSDTNAYDLGTTSDIQSEIAADSDVRTLALFDLDETDGFSGIAALSNLLPFDPGTGPFAGGVLNGRTLGGVSADALTPTQKANLITKGYTVNIETAGRAHALGGKAGSGEWIDKTRFVDWFVTRLQEDLAAMQLDNRRVPYDARGVTMVEGVLRGRLAIGLASGGITPGSESVSVPPVENSSTNDRAARVYNGSKIAFKYAGAIQNVGVSITITD